jgi:hypothetical protein
MKKLFEMCQNNNVNVSFTWQRINDYSIEIYKGYKSSYELIFYTDGHTDKKQAIKKALLFLNEKYSISQ